MYPTIVHCLLCFHEKCEKHEFDIFSINHYERAYNSSCPRLPRHYHTDSRRVRSCLPETVEKKTLTLRTRFPASGAFGGRVKSSRNCTLNILNTCNSNGGATKKIRN